MKIIALWDNYAPKHTLSSFNNVPAFSMLSDSCLLREGRPFYVPEWDDDFRLFPSFAIRIDRLGKSIQPKFVHRYWSEGTVWLNVRACTLERKYREAGLPIDAAVAFDNSLISAPFFDMDARKAANFRFEVRKNDDTVCSMTNSELALGVEQAVSALSCTSMLKTGDIIMLGFAHEGIKITEGDEIEVLIGGEKSTEDKQTLVRFKIK